MLRRRHFRGMVFSLLVFTTSVGCGAKWDNPILMFISVMSAFAVGTFWAAWVHESHQEQPQSQVFQVMEKIRKSIAYE